jgi:DNA adenine methylase
MCEKPFKTKQSLEVHKVKKRPCTKNEKTEKTEILEESKDQKDPIKPFLKWVGGKTQIIDKLLSLFPKDFNAYHEPFLGGGSVLFALLTKGVKGPIYASDINPSLIGLYQNVQKYPEELIKELRVLCDAYESCEKEETTLKTALKTALKTVQKTAQETYYYWLRQNFNKMTREEQMHPSASAMFLFMNKTCFRGLYREGPNGFNVPFGNYKNPSIFDEDHIRIVSNMIKDVTFSVASFEDSLKWVKEGDFVYLDPPYVPVTETSFVAYQKNGFHHHDMLFEWCKTTPAKFILSNADAPLVREAFPPPFQVHQIECRRAIHSKNPESKVCELLITNP